MSSLQLPSSFEWCHHVSFNCACCDMSSEFTWWYQCQHTSCSIFILVLQYWQLYLRICMPVAKSTYPCWCHIVSFDISASHNISVLTVISMSCGRSRSERYNSHCDTCVGSDVLSTVTPVSTKILQYQLIYQYLQWGQLLQHQQWQWPAVIMMIYQRLLLKLKLPSFQYAVSMSDIQCPDEISCCWIKWILLWTRCLIDTDSKMCIRFVQKECASELNRRVLRILKPQRNVSHEKVYYQKLSYQCWEI